MRVPAAIVLALIMIVAAIASPATSGSAIFGADESLALGQVSDFSQSASVGQRAYISDEYAVQKIEETFGPDVAASLKHRASQTTQSSLDDSLVRYAEATSNTWCGYQVIDTRANAVRATFNVCKTSTTHALTGSWVGLGNSASGLIQTGYCMRNNPPYSYFKAWYELLPAGPVYIDDFSIHVGDLLGATVQRDWLYGANWYYLCIVNETTGYYFADVFNYIPSPVCAEWIVETPATWKIGTWTGGDQHFWDAYWWDAANPYITYGITEGAFHWHIKMNTGSPYNEHMTAYYDGPTAFYAKKTST